MSRYRRLFVPGSTYFFTVVTYRRRPLFDDPHARACLRKAIAQTRKKTSFEIVALCLLPDHLHTIFTLPENDSDYSLRWARIKTYFTRQYAASACAKAHPTLTPSRRHRREHALWQRRFLEHLIRDDEDFRRHVDYIHYNPVKHGLAARPADWEWSTFHKYVKQGIYDDDWGIAPSKRLLALGTAHE